MAKATGTHTDLTQYFKTFYSDFLEDDVKELQGGACIYYYHHFTTGVVMAFDTDQEFERQKKDHERLNQYVEADPPVVHIMQIKSTRYLIKYHCFQPADGSKPRKVLTVRFDPLPAAMTGLMVHPYAIAETSLLQESEPTPPECEIIVDLTDRLPAFTQVPAVVSSPLVNPEEWSQCMRDPQTTSSKARPKKKRPKKRK